MRGRDEPTINGKQKCKAMKDLEFHNKTTREQL